MPHRQTGNRLHHEDSKDTKEMRECPTESAFLGVNLQIIRPPIPGEPGIPCKVAQGLKSRLRLVSVGGPLAGTHFAYDHTRYAYIQAASRLVSENPPSHPCRNASAA